MHFLNFAVVGALVIGASAIPTSPRYVLHEKRDAAPKAWVKRDRLGESVNVPVRIGMTQSNLDRGYDLLMEVSAHNSPKYGQHYTAEEIAELFAPSQKSVDVITEWLVSAGIAAEKISQSANKQWMQFDAAAHELEGLLKTEYNIFEHTKTGKVTVACDEYHVPEHVQEHVDYITPGLKLFSPTKKSDTGLQKRTFGVTSGKGKAGLKGPLVKTSSVKLGEAVSPDAASPFPCDEAATPQCIATMYNITVGVLAAPGNQLGIFEDLDDMYASQDLNLFFSNFFPTIPQGTHPTLNAVDGATAPVANFRNAGPESDLDFQISYPIIWPQNSVLFQTDDDVYEADYVFEGFFNTFLDAIDGSYCSFVDPLDPPYPDPARNGFKGALECGLYTPTNVISISYGGQEFDLPSSYQTRQCNEFMKLGLQGVSIVLASGDSGVAGPAGDDSADGCLGTSGQVFSPDFPATCPFITTVGATFLPPGADENIDAEIAVNRFGSGGGFSNIYAIPSYQATAVNDYLTNFPPPYPSYTGLNDTDTIGANGGIFNSAGRAYPDVSAVGDNVLIVLAEQAVLIGGTSAATPVWGAILTRINEERIAVGKSTVGFVNPVLYANPSAMHDITSGSNPGCGTDGFAVTPGWDPVTGLGTPNFPALLEVFLALP